MLCEYGCGQEAIYPPHKGTVKWCCESHWSRCPHKIEENKKNNIGRKASQETKNKMSKSRIGQIAWNKGISHTQETKDKMSNSHKGCIPWNVGKNLSEEHRKNISKGYKKPENYVCSDETKKKISEGRKGIIPWNKGKTGIYSKESLEKMSNSSKGKTTWNKGKTGIYSEETLNKIKIGAQLSISQIKNKYPTFFKIEEIRYNPDKPGEKEIQVHCKNHNCQNSKDKNGWFTPTNSQIYERMRQIENENGNQSGYLYCSEECKQECPLYGKSVSQLIKEDKIAAGIIEDPWYNSSEYQTWRQQVFMLDDSKCVWCGKPADHAHHVMPQKTHPELSLDPENGVSCCRECHYKYGHRDRWCTTGYLAKLVCDRIIRIQSKI